MSTKTKSLLIVLTLIVLGAVAFVLSKNGSDENATNVDITTQAVTEEDTQASSPAELQTITSTTVEAHDKKDDCWTIINGNVYDITSYIPRHPGGDEILLACGADGTSLFVARTDDEGQEIGSGTPHSSSAKNQLENFLIGTLAQ